MSVIYSGLSRDRARRVLSGADDRGYYTAEDARASLAARDREEKESRGAVEQRSKAGKQEVER